MNWTAAFEQTAEVNIIDLRKLSEDQQSHALATLRDGFPGALSMISHFLAKCGDGEEHVISDSGDSPIRQFNWEEAKLLNLMHPDYEFYFVKKGLAIKKKPEKLAEEPSRRSRRPQTSFAPIGSFAATA